MSKQMDMDNTFPGRLPQILMLNVGFARHDADWNFRDVSSPFTRLYYVTEGEAEIAIEPGRRMPEEDGMTFEPDIYKLTPGNMYIVPAFRMHTDICTGIFNHYYIHLYEDTSESPGFIDDLDFPFQIKGTPDDLHLFETICSHNESMRLRFSDPRIYDNKSSLIQCVRLNRERPLHERMEAAGIMYQLLSRFIAGSKPKYESADPRVRHALRYLQDNLCEDIPLETLAREACLSRDHFIKIFNREVGCSPIRYIIQQRMTRAQLLLASSDKPVKEVALRLGYNDFSYFSRLFKKHSGLSPLQYRESFNRQ